MPARMFLVSALKPGRRTATDRAQSAVTLLMIRDMLHRLDDKLPDAQWAVLDNPALMPDCVRPFLIPAPEPTDSLRPKPQAGTDLASMAGLSSGSVRLSSALR